MSTEVSRDSGDVDYPESISTGGESISTGMSHLTLDMEWNSYATDSSGTTLETLPSELLLLIFSYVEAPFLIKTVAKVCRKFFNLLSSSSYWKTRLTAWYHPCKYPPVPVKNDSFDWMEACMETEYIYSLWQQKNDKLEHLSFVDIQYGTVDAVHLFKGGNLLAAGSRDRSITIFDLSRPEVRDPRTCRDSIVFADYKIHKGWVWCISSNDKHLCSGSWDSKIRVWDVCAEDPLVSTYRCQSAVLDIHMDNDQIIAGGNDKCLYIIDTRTPNVFSTKLHHMPILCLAVNERHIITGSEDGFICVYDRKANSVFKKLTVRFDLATVPLTIENYPMCLSYSDHQIWVGDRTGQLKLIDTSDDKFEIVQTFDFGHKTKLTCVKHSLGALFTTSGDRHIRVMEPTLNPQPIACFDPKLGEIASMDYQHNILVCGGSNFKVEVWRPQEES